MGVAPKWLTNWVDTNMCDDAAWTLDALINDMYEEESAAPEFHPSCGHIICVEAVMVGYLAVFSHLLKDRPPEPELVNDQELVLGWAIDWNRRSRVRGYPSQFVWELFTQEAGKRLDLSLGLERPRGRPRMLARQ